MSTKHKWEHFEHEADIGVRGFGANLEQAFSSTAEGLIEVISPIENIAAEKAIKLQCKAPDHELLLVDWLNALIYEIAVHKMLFSRFEVIINNYELEATAWGESIDKEKHNPSVEVKGATYTELKVEQQENGEWLAQCIVDV